MSRRTNFNEPNEITIITREAITILFRRGVVVRNHAVLQRGLNDDLETWRLFVRQLGQIRLQPYYVYVHELVWGVLRLNATRHWNGAWAVSPEL